MLNLKKGLALVLAAATAFTFAPVANLGNAVEANAAATYTIDGALDTSFDFTLDANKTYTVSSSDKHLTLSIAAKSNSTVYGSLTANMTTTGAGATLASAIATTATDLDAQILASEANQTVEITPTATQAGTYTVTVKYAPTNSVTTYKVVANDQSASDLSKAKIGGTAISDKDPKGNFYAKIGADTKTMLDVSASGFFTEYWDGETTKTAAKTKFASDNDAVLSVAATGDNTKIATITTRQAGSANITVTELDSSDNVIATAKIPVVVGQSGSNIENVTFSSIKTGNKAVLLSGYMHNPSSTQYAYNASGKLGRYDTATYNQGAASIALDTLVNKTAQLAVDAKTSDVTYSSNNTLVATVSANGLITATGKGTATITAHVGQNNTYAAGDASITVTVTDESQDVIGVKADGNTVNDSDSPLNLDSSDQTAATAKKSSQLSATSAAGATEFMYALYKADKTTAVAGNADDYITLTSTGAIATGKVTTNQTYFVKVTTKKNGNIAGGEAWVKVVINTLPEDSVTVPETVNLDLDKNNIYTLAPVAGNGNTAVFKYEVDPDADKGQQLGVVRVSSNKVLAQALGQTRVKVTEFATAKTRETVKYITFNVVNEVSVKEKAASDLKVADSALTVKVGDTASAGAFTTASGAAITYTSSDTDVATVAADGTITAVAPGTAVVTVKAAETDKVNAGTATIVVTVPSNPQKVTGVKVSNKKGAYVTVKWTSQGSNVNYRVYKKVGKGKWVGKNVAGNKTTLSVKKGAKVQVKVKSYAKDASGNTTWGPAATKAKTFKTDKK